MSASAKKFRSGDSQILIVSAYGSPRDHYRDTHLPEDYTLFSDDLLNANDDQTNFPGTVPVHYGD